MASIDVADHVGVGFENHVFVDEAGSGNRRAAGVNRALDAVFAGPCDHAASGGSIFHAAQADFAEKFHAGGGEFFEVVFDHALFENRRTGVDLHASGTKRVETRAARRSPLLSARQYLWGGPACGLLRRKPSS